MEVSKAHTLSIRLAAELTEKGGVTLGHFSYGVTAIKEAVYLTADEMEALIAWYTDGSCPICADTINQGETICASCFEDALSYRQQHGR